MSPAPEKFRPRFNVAWGTLIALAGFGLSTLLGAPRLRIVFGLLAVALLLLLGRRALAAVRERLLWRLRSRLLATYVFIGVIPVVLLVLMGLVAAWTLYGNVAVSLVTDQLQTIESDLQDETSDVVAALEVAGRLEGRLRPALVAQIVAIHTAHIRQRLPAVEIQVPEFSDPGARPLPVWLRGQKFAGVVTGDKAELVSAMPVSVAGQTATVVVIFPLDARALDRLGRDIGPVTLALLGPEVTGTAPPGRVRVTFRVGNKRYPVLAQVRGSQTLPPASGWWDEKIGFFATHPTRLRETGEAGPPLLLSVDSRVGLINRQLGSRLGEFSYFPLLILGAAGVLFLLLELAAVWAGVKLTRTITGTVDDLQVATEQVQAANFSHRIRLRGRDQLSGLAQAFNSMSSSIEALIEESKEKQRLQNELDIARQVQEQLFPREVPRLETLELVGRCRPARMVSGDYYDYGLAEPGKLIFTIGDISGKGISAALLMATIQSILRSQVYAARLLGQLGQLTMAELVSRVNRQLCATTSTEKFSTLFIGCYEDATRRLTYTNAGHLPPLVLGNGRTEPLSVGGMVVGLFSDVGFEQATVQLQPGDWLVAYTDGLTEVENSYEEEYGPERLKAFLQRTADQTSTEQLAEAVFAELQQWAPGAEQSDDRTLLVARVR